MDTAPQIVPHLAPEGRHVYLSESGGSRLRDGQDRKWKVEYVEVEVGDPNPSCERDTGVFSPRGATGEPGGTKIGT